MSSLITSTLMSLSMFSDEYADPKSSISTAMLSACSLRMVLSTLDRFRVTALSVISAWSSRASTSYSFSSPVSVSATSIWSMSTMETFTEIGTRLRPSRSQRASIRTTERHTNTSSREICPRWFQHGTWPEIPHHIRVVPTHQRLGTDDGTRSRIAFGLQVEAELVVVERTVDLVERQLRHKLVGGRRPAHFRCVSQTDSFLSPRPIRDIHRCTVSG